MAKKEDDINLENKENVTETTLQEMSLEERILNVINEIRISKTGKNTYSNYDYFRPEAINQKVNPLLLKYKIFPHFTVETRPYIIEEAEQMDGAIKNNTKTEYRDVAVLTFSDIFKKDESVKYEMKLVDLEIKGANKMQNLGGVRTYAKRYLYMEALNISDDSLDLDSNDMASKAKLKPSSDETKIKEVINKISLKVAALRETKEIADASIAAEIKKVHSENGNPSANYKNCQTVEDADKILKALEKAF